MDILGELFGSLRYTVFSMSEHLKDIGFRLRNKRELIIEHLLKLYFFRGSPWDRDWVVHTYKAVFSVQTRKGNNKLPPEDWMYDCLFGGIEDIWGNIYKGFISVMRVESENWGSSVLKADREKETFGFVKCYMLWLARRLHEAGEVSFNEVSAEIDDLLEAFPFDPRFDIKEGL
jgi:hypothetical protein